MVIVELFVRGVKYARLLRKTCGGAACAQCVACVTARLVNNDVALSDIHTQRGY